TVSLHYSIESDLRHDRQFHARGSLRLRAPFAGGLSPLLRTLPPRSDTVPRTSAEGLLVRRLLVIRQCDGLRGDCADFLTRPGHRCRDGSAGLYYGDTG